MKILIVLAGTRKAYLEKRNKPFVYEQVEILKKNEIKFEFYFIEGGGRRYLNHFIRIRQKIYQGDYDLLHAHYGLSGLVSLFVFGIPKVITFHGSDINKPTNRFFSFIASRFADHNILVNEYMVDQLLLRKNYSVIPCGVDFELFSPIDKKEARNRLELDLDQSYILFSSSFNNAVKNYPLAKRAVDLLDVKVQLIELKNKTREEVCLLINACDLLLMTSYNEGSPQVVKETLACNTPVVSTDVGDVKELISDLNNCFITSYDPKNIAQKISMILKGEVKKCEGRKVVRKYRLQNVANSIKDIYRNVSEQ